MKKYLGIAIKYLGIGIIAIDLINLFILRGQNWQLHNFSFFLKHFTDHLIFIFWIFVGLIVTVFGILLSSE